MKWLLAMLSKGRDVSDFFADVVKNIVVKSIEVKKMVYIYIVHYADYDDTCREIALLSINSFQKDLVGENQLIRGLALRVMTSVRVPDIIQIQLLAARKCASDQSPYVRKCAATALTKIYAFDPDQITALLQILDKLLKDNSTMVLGSAVAAFNEMCPSNYEILHRSYRKLCHLLADMDEWTQITVLEVLTRYSRNQFTDPAPGVAAAVKIRAKQRSASAVKGHISNTVTKKVVKKAFYSDEEDEEDDVVVAVEMKDDQHDVFVKTGSIVDNNDGDGNLDPDHRLVLRSSLPLLKSRNAGVVLAVCALQYYCGPQSDSTTQQVGKALVRILRNRREIQYVVLTCISTMAQERPALFRPFLSDFFIKATDPVFNKLLKLEILTSIVTKDNIESILRELQIYVKHRDVPFVCASVRAIGRAADADPAVADRCMEGVFLLLRCSTNEQVIGECVNILRLLIQQNANKECSSTTLHKLTKMLITPSAITVPLARSSIIWLVGEGYDVLTDVSPDVLRILSIGFADESNEAKTQIANFAIKLALRLPNDDNVQSLMTYVLEMARYDTDTDIRDRSRFLTALMGLAPASESDDTTSAYAVDEEALEELSEHSMGIMLAPKLPPITLLGSVDIEGLPNFNLGSLSSLVGHYITGYEPLASWPTHQPDANVRDANRFPENDHTNTSDGNGISNTNGSTWNYSKDQDSSDEDDNHDSAAGKKVIKGFYGEESDTESSNSGIGSGSDDGSSSGDASDDDDESGDGSDGDDDNDESSNTSDDSNSDGSSESEEAVKIPLRSNGVVTRKSTMRKVAPQQQQQKKIVFTDSVDDLLLMPTQSMNISGNNSSHVSNSLVDMLGSSTTTAFSSNTKHDNKVFNIMSSFDSLAPPAQNLPTSNFYDDDIMMSMSSAPANTSAMNPSSQNHF